MVFLLGFNQIGGFEKNTYIHTVFAGLHSGNGAKFTF